MLVDIHSHKYPCDNNIVVYNLLFSQVEELFLSKKKILFSVGLHPWHLDGSVLEEFRMIERCCEDSRLVAIGECGLDKYSKTSLKQQIDCFEKQVQLAEEKQKTLLVHCVGSFNELFDLKKKWKPQQKWIIHGFRGKPQLAEQALKTGCCLSYGEFFNEESVRITPTENLFLETDESRLSIEAIYERIAAIKSLNVQDLSAGRLLLEEYF